VIVKWPYTGKICILDVEYTAWEGSQERNWQEPWEHREIFQIGAVLIDLDEGFKEIDHFDELVIPTLNPFLSDYSTKLSSITNKQLQKRGLTFKEAIELFSDFLGSGIPILVNGYDGAVIRENCWFNKLDRVLFNVQIYDIRPAIANILGLSLSQTISSELPALLQIEESGIKHNGLNDARAISLSLKKLCDQGRLNFK
jgi:inhibitor of KinA sporulation pathway (predicted exonuclease)